MGLISKVRLLLKIRKPTENLIQEVSKVKSGYKTTEFWMTIISQLLTLAGALQGVIDPKTAALIIAGLNAIYGFLRTLAKAGTTTNPEAPSDPTPATPE